MTGLKGIAEIVGVGLIGMIGINILADIAHGKDLRTSLKNVLGF